MVGRRLESERCDLGLILVSVNKHQKYYYQCLMIFGCPRLSERCSQEDVSVNERRILKFPVAISEANIHEFLTSLDERVLTFVH